jgi:hypothetical protein
MDAGSPFSAILHAGNCLQQRQRTLKLIFNARLISLFEFSSYLMSFLWSCFVKKMFLTELCSSSSCTRWLSGFLNFVCMLPLLNNTFGYLSLAVLRSCYSADVHAPCSHSLTLLPRNSNRWFLYVCFAMAAEQKLVRRWSETRLFFRIAHCLRLLSLRV